MRISIKGIMVPSIRIKDLVVKEVFQRFSRITEPVLWP